MLVCYLYTLSNYVTLCKNMLTYLFYKLRILEYIYIYIYIMNILEYSLQLYISIYFSFTWVVLITNTLWTSLFT